MSSNPLFPTNQNDNKKPDDNPPAPVKDSAEPAVEMIRQKVQALYENEPDASEEVQEVDVVKPRTKHQQFIYDLQASGKSLAEIQAAWHQYYLELPDEEKHEVWREFYDSYEQTSKYNNFVKKQVTEGKPKNIYAPVVSIHEPEPHVKPDLRSPKNIKNEIIERAKNSKPKKHPRSSKPKSIFHSLGFGLATGSIVLIVFLFGLFNQFIIAPFIQPGNNPGNIPLIINASDINTNQPEIIIPKINLEIPIDFHETSDNENVMETALEHGIVHYPSTVFPGQKGNAAFFGHSSNNILNPGKYKFAFVLLHTLVTGDTFYITYNGTLYAYQVIHRVVVSPSDVGVLNQTYGQTATATLITCDPPGTSWNRLVVTGKQISPDPSTAKAAAAPSTVAQPTQIIGNGPSLWSRFWHWLF